MPRSKDPAKYPYVYHRILRAASLGLPEDLEALSSYTIPGGIMVPCTTKAEAEDLRLTLYGLMSALKEHLEPLGESSRYLQLRVKLLGDQWVLRIQRGDSTEVALRLEQMLGLEPTPAKFPTELPGVLEAKGKLEDILKSTQENQDAVLRSLGFLSARDILKERAQPPEDDSEE